MEQKILPVKISAVAFQNIEAIFDYGAETFSPIVAERFVFTLLQKLETLDANYLLHTECRFIPTKSKKYRMFTYTSYLVIYKIEMDFIAVLTIIHKSRCIASIRAARRIKV
jgi:plasmid stabilization system protein ParE